MSRRRKRWLLAIGVSVAASLLVLIIAASIAARRFEPFIREQAIAYMGQRFNSDVELAKLRIHMPKLSPLRLLLTKGRGVVARVEGEGISMRFRGNSDLPPLFFIRKFQFNVDIGTLAGDTIVVPNVVLEGVQINIPPKGQRPRVAAASAPAEPPRPGLPDRVLIEQVRVTQAKLSILPRDPTRKPLDFNIHSMRFDSAGRGVAMKYHAALVNPKPPGNIDSWGTFGPWVAGEPGDTPLAGKYVFENADLGVFNGIAGILKSSGEFTGRLDSIQARGEAYVPDFRLKMAGNRVPLTTRFEVLVDGTNGNTTLKPVQATLGRTSFTTSGAVIKHEGDRRRTIMLDVSMPHGDLRDLLRLASKGSPFMEGTIAMKTKIGIPPLSGKIREKLMLDGTFQLSGGKFLKSNIQDQIDQLSRRGQGEPGNLEGIDEVISQMKGVFRLRNEVITFRNFSFGVPGAVVQLAGDYNLERDALDFHGALRLDAKVSQTMTGWKRWALKPVDPFFAKNGAGTYLKIKVDGTSRQPKFGLDRGRDDDESRARRR